MAERSKGGRSSVEATGSRSTRPHASASETVSVPSGAIDWSSSAWASWTEIMGISFQFPDGHIFFQFIHEVLEKKKTLAPMSGLDADIDGAFAPGHLAQPMNHADRLAWMFLFQQRDFFPHHL